MASTNSAAWSGADYRPRSPLLAATDYLGEIWRCRYFWWSLVRMDLRTRYRRSILGIGWSLLHPIAMTMVICLVFSRLMGIPPAEYAPFLLCGLSFWGYISTVCTGGCDCFYVGESYIRQHPAPLAIYPLRTMLGATFHFLLALGVVLGLTWVVRGFGNLAALPSLLPVLVVLMVIGWALALLGGVANVYFPDTSHLCQVGLQLLMYCTPIIYKAEHLESHGLGWMVRLNPFAVLVEMIRGPILNGVLPSPDLFASSLIFAAVAAGAAIAVLIRVRTRLIFHL